MGAYVSVLHFTARVVWTRSGIPTLQIESSISNMPAAANVTACLWNHWNKYKCFYRWKFKKKTNFIHHSCKQTLKVCICLCRWLKRMSGSSCPMGTTAQQSLGPTPTSPRQISSYCPNRMELRPPSDRRNLEPTSDTSANRRWNLWRCSKNRYAHLSQHLAAVEWIWVYFSFLSILCYFYLYF